MNYSRMLLWGILTLFLTHSSANQAKVVSLTVLYHPTTQACIGLIGDRHYDIYDPAECQEEQNNDTLIMPHLTTYADEGHTIYFEGNEHFLKALCNLSLDTQTQIYGLHALLYNSAHKPYAYKNYKAIDPRTGGVAACIDLAYRFDEIALPLYNSLLDILATQAEISHDPDVCAEYEAAYSTDYMTVLNNYLYSPHGTYSICPCYMHHLLVQHAQRLYPDMTNISFNATYKHICDTTMHITDMLAPYTQTESAYKDIAHAILQRHEHMTTTAHTFFTHWLTHTPDFLSQPFFNTVHTMGATTGDLATSCGYGKKTDAQKYNKKFYNQLIDTFADTTFAAYLLNTPDALLYAGASHCTTLNELLCSADTGFICIYHVGSESHTTACSDIEIKNFFSNIKKMQK